MDTDPATSPRPTSPSAQRYARVLLSAVLVGLGIWILSEFLAALAWAGVLAIALWPVYRRLLRVMPPGSGHIAAPLLAILAVGVIFIAPLVLLGMALARESHFVIEFIIAAFRIHRSKNAF